MTRGPVPAPATPAQADQTLGLSRWTLSTEGERNAQNPFRIGDRSRRPDGRLERNPRQRRRPRRQSGRRPCRDRALAAAVQLRDGSRPPQPDREGRDLPGRSCDREHRPRFHEPAGRPPGLLPLRLRGQARLPHQRRLRWRLLRSDDLLLLRLGGKTMKNVLAMLILAVAFLALAGTTPASAETASPAVPAPAVTAPVQPGCGTGLELNLATPAQGETCPAAQPASTAPDFIVAPAIGTLTCRCSCGFPCKTDADCGGALGSCRAGISCC